MDNEFKRRKYDAEFKRNAINLANEPGKTANGVEKSLGIAQGLIGRWRQQLKNQGELAFPGKGIEALTLEQKQIKELEKKLKDAEMERDILKKAVAIFSRAPK
jgi:transposase